MRLSAWSKVWALALIAAVGLSCDKDSSADPVAPGLPPESTLLANLEGLQDQSASGLTLEQAFCAKSLHGGASLGVLWINAAVFSRLIPLALAWKVVVSGKPSYSKKTWTWKLDIDRPAQGWAVAQSKFSGVATVTWLDEPDREIEATLRITTDAVEDFLIMTGVYKPQKNSGQWTVYWYQDEDQHPTTSDREHPVFKVDYSNLNPALNSVDRLLDITVLAGDNTDTTITYEVTNNDDTVRLLVTESEANGGNTAEVIWQRGTGTGSVELCTPDCTAGCWDASQCNLEECP